MLKILIRPQARSDLINIWCYTYDNWGEPQANVYTNELGKLIEKLASNPILGNSINHLRKDYRLYHIKHHFIIYRQTTEIIDVVRILGESMDVKRHV